MEDSVSSSSLTHTLRQSHLLFQLSSLSVFGPLVIFSLYNSILSQSSLLVRRPGCRLSAMAAACEKAVINSYCFIFRLRPQFPVARFSKIFPSRDLISGGFEFIL